MKVAKSFLIAGLILLVSVEVLRVYFIMPFPGSQQQETVELAYFLHQNILVFRVAGLLAVMIAGLISFRSLTKSWRIGVAIGLVFWGLVFYMFNFRFSADKMFYQPSNIAFLHRHDNKVDPSKLVLGVVINHEAKAYPIEIIGYHHQVRDSIGGVPVMVTYCTVCRTGRVFSPVVDGKQETFRLVGMDHFNAMFEDASTQSWWRQVTGEAIVGTLKGKVLEELPAQQMALRAWLNVYPDSKILQPDSLYLDKYAKLEGFDTGTLDSHLEYRDTLSWKAKSWVVGVETGPFSKAYDWNELVQYRVINDTLRNLSLLLYLESDSTSLHVWNRDSLDFFLDNEVLRDRQTNSAWNTRGECFEGKLTGQKLARIQAYQEFWHSWRTFHSRTMKY